MTSFFPPVTLPPASYGQGAELLMGQYNVANIIPVMKAFATNSHEVKATCHSWLTIHASPHPKRVTVHNLGWSGQSDQLADPKVLFYRSSMWSEKAKHRDVFIQRKLSRTMVPVVSTHPKRPVSRIVRVCTRFFKSSAFHGTVPVATALWLLLSGLQVQREWSYCSVQWIVDARRHFTSVCSGLWVLTQETALF